MFSITCHPHHRPDLLSDATDFSLLTDLTTRLEDLEYQVFDQQSQIQEQVAKHGRLEEKTKALKGRVKGVERGNRSLKERLETENGVERKREVEKMVIDMVDEGGGSEA